MSQHNEDPRESFGLPLKALTIQAIAWFVALGTFAFAAWNSSASGFSGLSLNATRDFKHEEFLQAIINHLSDFKIVGQLNRRDKAIKIFSANVNFETNSAELSQRQGPALGRVAELLQAALQCTDTNNELQLAAKPLEEPVIAKAKCHQGEKIEFRCESLFRDIKIKKILVTANESSHALLAPGKQRRTQAQILNERNELLVNAFHSCEPELRRYSYVDSKPLLRTAIETETQKQIYSENEHRDWERMQLQFEFE